MKDLEAAYIGAAPNEMIRFGDALAGVSTAPLATSPILCRDHPVGSPIMWTCRKDGLPLEASPALAGEEITCREENRRN